MNAFASGIIHQALRLLMFQRFNIMLRPVWNSHRPDLYKYHTHSALQLLASHLNTIIPPQSPFTDNQQILSWYQNLCYQRLLNCFESIRDWVLRFHDDLWIANCRAVRNRLPISHLATHTPTCKLYEANTRV